MENNIHIHYTTIGTKVTCNLVYTFLKVLAVVLDILAKFASGGNVITLTKIINVIEKEIVRLTLNSSNSISQASKKLGIPRQSLQSKMKKFGLVKK